MGIDNHFIHKCDIKRPKFGAGNENAHGLSNSSKVFVASGVRFRLVEKEQRIWKSEEAEGAVITVYKGFFSPGVDLEERDELVNIVLENGTSVNEKYVIEEILTRRGMSARHLSVKLKRIS